MSDKGNQQQWQSLSEEAFFETFCDRLDQSTNDQTKARSYSTSDIPICSVCDKIDFNCSQLPACSHPACKKCLAIAHANTKSPPSCRVCAVYTVSQSREKPSGNDQNEVQPSPEVHDEQTAQSPHAPKSTTGTAEVESVPDMLFRKRTPVAESIQRIQEAVEVATKYTQCSACLQDKKWQSPDLLCLDCGLSYCNRCSSKHKAAQANSAHIMVPVEGRKTSVKSKQNVRCPRHADKELNLYCTNCELVICSACAATQHTDCPEKVAMEEHADQERDELKHCHNKYSQVMKFFSEQRRGVEETAAALNTKRRGCQSEVRKFFSVLIKACMDVEGSLLEELEMAVSDHTDLLQEHSGAWLQLQENMQQLMDLTYNLHVLPSADFLPLATVAKATLSALLREGETLAASAPPQMTLSLCLEQSSQRGAVKRIKEIGATALTVNTHKVLALRLITSTSLQAPQDTTKPLVTSLVQLTNNLLVAADFNNSSLKLLIQENSAEEWHISQVLALKSRPFGMAKLHASPAALGKGKELSQEPMTDLESSGGASTTNSGTAESSDSQQRSKETKPRSSPAGSWRRKLSMERQAAIAMDDHELVSAEESEGSYTMEKVESTDMLQEVQVAVSSPDGHCMILAMPVAGSGAEMRILQTLKVDKGCWGLAALDDHTLVASSVDSGRSFITMMDTEGTFQRRLRLTDGSNTTPLVSPRHLTAISRTNILVSDHGKKALVSMCTDGKVTYTFTGHGNQRLSRPEGMCTDNHGRVFLADSGDNSIVVLSKTGRLYSKTTPQSGLTCPQAMCIDRNSQLYVANDSGQVLNVYDIIEEG